MCVCVFVYGASVCVGVEMWGVLARMCVYACAHVCVCVCVCVCSVDVPV